MPAIGPRRRQLSPAMCTCCESPRRARSRLPLMYPWIGGPNATEPKEVRRDAICRTRGSDWPRRRPRAPLSLACHTSSRPRGRGRETSASAIHDRAGPVIGTVVVFHSVSAARALSLRLAQRDCRTGLPNRMLPNDRMTQAISLSRRRGNQLALLSHVERAEDAAVSARARC
jgi:hypothetical protein